MIDDVSGERCMEYMQIILLNSCITLKKFFFDIIIHSKLYSKRQKFKALTRHLTIMHLRPVHARSILATHEEEKYFLWLRTKPTETQ